MDCGITGPVKFHFCARNAVRRCEDVSEKITSIWLCPRSSIYNVTTYHVVVVTAFQIAVNSARAKTAAKTSCKICSCLEMQTNIKLIGDKYTPMSVDGGLR